MRTETSALLCIYPGFAELQIAAALDLLRGRTELTVAAAERAIVRNEGGLPVQPDAAWRELITSKFDVLVLPGAVDIEFPFRHPDLHALLRAAVPRARVVGAICGGPVILAGAGALGGRRYTTSFSREQRDFLGVSDSGFVDADVVTDGNLVCARGHAYGRFALTVAAAAGIDSTRLARYVLQGATDAGNTRVTA